MTDLRTLAQAVVDADCPEHAGGTRRRRLAQAEQALYAVTCSADVARAILAALDAADAQGYARAMGEVVAFDERDPCPVCDVADWARERLPAAAERD